MTIVDFHSHIIPGVDDGSESLGQSLAALQKMWEQGITRVITTPHLRAATLNNPADFDARIKEIDEAWTILLAAARETLPELQLHRGVELALDEPLNSFPDERTRLAGTRFMLVEFPFFRIPPNSGQALVQLRGLGVTPIVAHPERYTNVDDDLAVLDEWKRSGAFLQLNAGSLVGAYGERIESNGWKVLERGFPDYLSSDYHSRGDCLTARAEERIKARNADSQFRVLSSVNGDRLLRGLDPSPLPALDPRDGRWQRLRKALRRH